MKRSVKVFIGEVAKLVGSLGFSAEGNREACSFAYADSWLADKDRIQIDPALPLIAGPQFHAKSNNEHASIFHGCFADSEPDGWGTRVVRREHAKRRRESERDGIPFDPRPLNSLDFLLYVDDASRIGALRFRDEDGKFVRTPPADGGHAPPLIELSALLDASRAVESGKETAADLRYLLGKGTSVGGMRPKCTVVDDNGDLSIGKFPSDTDTRAVTKGEVLALRLAAKAGISASTSRIVYADGTPVTLVKRFDRHNGKRLMYASARTMLGLADDQEHAYTEIADVLRQKGAAPERDCEEMWRRLVFSILVTNVDDHLNNHGFLHVGNDLWTLCPAFDINPFPDKARVLKTWISEETGADARIDAALKAAAYFGLRNGREKEVLAEVLHAVKDWRRIASTREVDMSPGEMEPFENAFEHEEVLTAERALQSKITAAAPVREPASRKQLPATSAAHKPQEP